MKAYILDESVGVDMAMVSPCAFDEMNRKGE